MRKRLPGLLFILPLLLALGMAVYKLGPQPHKTMGQTATDVSPPTGSTQSKPVSPEKSGLLELFGMHQTAVAKGRVELTPTEYGNSLEDLYRQRGYDKLETFDPGNPPPIKKKRGKQPSAKTGLVRFFQRNDAEGIVNISATGIDADLSSNVPALEPYTFNTLVVSAEGGGANWATYKLEMDRSKLDRLAQLEDGEFPGSDPTDVPRLPGLQRIYALSTGRGSLAIYEGKEASDTAVMLRYLEEMPRYGWRLDSAATSEANKVATGVMCFVRGTKSCLIWVTPGKSTGTTNVTISSH